MANCGRTIVVTGGAGHLGLAVARWWARPGISIVLVDRDSSSLEKGRSELAAFGANAMTLAADLTDPTSLQSIEQFPDALWSIPPSLIVAHGEPGKGDGKRAPRLGELDLVAWRKIFEVNLTSVVFAIQSLLPIMQKAGGGRIVLVSSAAGLSASSTAAFPYSVSKAAVAALPRLLATQLASSNVLINAVAPGKFVNPNWPGDPVETKRYAATVPLGRLASTEEVAALIGFLSSEANTYLTGQTILQDGGRLQAISTGAS